MTTKQDAKLEQQFFERVNNDLRLSHPGLKCPGRNVSYLRDTKLEFDFAWASIRLAIEVQGGINSPTRHTGHLSYFGIRRDYRKTRQAQMEGWFIIHLSPEEIKDNTIWAEVTKPLLLNAINFQKKRYNVRF